VDKSNTFLKMHTLHCVRSLISIILAECSKPIEVAGNTVDVRNEAMLEIVVFVAVKNVVG